jgi:hypothetical protein
MEHLEKKSGQINLDSIRTFASQKTVREKLKTSDTFYIPTPDLPEVEKILNEYKISYKKMAHPTYNLTMFTVLN